MTLQKRRDPPAALSSVPGIEGKILVAEEGCTRKRVERPLVIQLGGEGQVELKAVLATD